MYVYFKALGPIRLGSHNNNNNRMLPNVIEMKSDGYCVAYNVRDYLVWNKRY